jgi:hypothetical protein
MSAFSNSFLGAFSGHDEWRKRAVWEKGRRIPGRDPNVWREDGYGFVIKYEDHGDRNSLYGWEIDHHPVPLALGGFDTLENLRPLHCTANATLGGFLGNALRGLR